MIAARRVYLYGIAFAAIWTLLNGAAGLLELILTALAEVIVGPLQIIGESSRASEVSFSVALTGIGLLVWTIHWGLAARATSRDEIPERRSAIRKLYLYGVLLVGGLVLAFQLRTLVVDLLGLIFGTVTPADILHGELIPPLAMSLATGILWAYHAYIARVDATIVPEAGAGATIRRWCVYLLAWTGLLMLMLGTVALLTRLFELVSPSAGTLLVDSVEWLALDVAGRSGSMLIGLLFWVAAWGWSTRQFEQPGGPHSERDSVLRKVYLYGILLMAVSWTVWNLGQMLYVALRSVLIPSEAGELWSSVQHDLGGKVAHVLVFGLAWAYHARALKREAAVAEVGRQASIRWIYGYIVAFVGASTLAAGLAGLLSTVLDGFVQPGTSSSPFWWQEQISLYATLIVVGLPVWLVPWLRLQREVGAAEARRSLVRRIYLFVALAGTVFTLLGTCVYVLYQLLRVLLGDRWTAGATSDLLAAVSAATVAGLFLAYHLQIFRRDAALALADEAAGPAGDLVTLLVVRPANGTDPAMLRAQLTATLPADTHVQTVQLPASEAARLLRSRQSED
jgi:hypothetical protein